MQFGFPAARSYPVKWRVPVRRPPVGAVLTLLEGFSVLQLLTRVFGSRNERLVRGYHRLTRNAAGFEEALQALSDEQLGAKTGEFRQRLADGATLDELSAEA
ncbi:MAG: hypothetical protein EOP08_02365, partial [Proteobacteria bacterium]